jgi:hypothetical protein
VKPRLPLFAAVQHMALQEDPLITPFKHSQRKLDHKPLCSRGLYGELECDLDVRSRLTAFLTGQPGGNHGFKTSLGS